MPCVGYTEAMRLAICVMAYGVLYLGACYHSTPGLGLTLSPTRKRGADALCSVSPLHSPPPFSALSGA